jgi:hypothetical protein
LLAILDPESAFQYIDPPSMHVNVKPTLPSGSPDRYDRYNYAKIKLPNGKVTCVGLPWIIESTITILSNVSFKVEITDVTAEDYETLRNALTANGFNMFNIEVVNVSVEPG